jgi:uncharacterized RDD family membrane protein YckC
VSNPYQPPRATEAAAPSERRPPTLARRAAASVIDAAPLVVACTLVTVPVFAIALILVAQQAAGGAVLDPSVGGDPILRRLPGHPVAAAAGGVWLALQLVAVAASGRSIGKWLCGVRLATAAGAPISRARAVARATLRGALAGALLLAGVLGPRWLRADPATFYAPYSLTEGMSLPPYPRAVAMIIALLVLLLVVHLLADAILVIAPSRRSLADRLAGTAIA